MEFTFSIRTALREAWHLYKAHWKFFVGVALVSVVFNIFSGEKIPDLIELVLGVTAFLWSIVMMKISLVAVDGKTEMLSFKQIKTFLPHWKKALGVIAIYIIQFSLIILGGILFALFALGTLASLATGFTALSLAMFILSIILGLTGIWVSLRLSFAVLAYLDKEQGVIETIKHSWSTTKGSVIWTIILVGLVSALLYIVGLVLFGIGILVTYPLALILMAKLYRALSAHFGDTHTVVPQPVEIPAHTETPAPQAESEEKEPQA